MKTLILFLLSVILTGAIFSQANTCGTANPFCSSQSYNFPNATSGSAPAGPNYGCLGSQPRPIWYYMEIGTSGTIDMLLQQTTGPNGTGSQIDVDFAMWGPYSNLSAGCTAIMSGSAAPIQCSFSNSYSEDLGLGVSGGTGTGLTTPPAAVAGQVYIVLLTNYNGAAGFISFNQTGGTGSADCSIVDPCSIDNFTATTSACNSATNTYTVNGNITVSNPPNAGQLIVQACDGTQTVVASAPFGTTTYPYSITGLSANGAACDVEVFFTDGACSQILTYTAPTCPPPVCSFTNINANISACQQGSVFDLTGTLTFVSPPSTGQLIVQDCNGNSATYNAPFTSPLNFAINGIDADGQPCNATAHFTADPACSISVSYTNTPSCECTVDIGTFSTTTAGASTSTYVLCYGDEILLEPTGDYTPAGEALNPPLAEGYEPGIAWIMYSCPPTVAVTPHATNAIGDDPCFIGIVSSTDLYDINDLYWINGYPGTFTNNTVYFVPITMYNLTEYYYSYVNGGLPCYEMGSPYAIQYLPEITTTVAPNCQAGTVSVTVQGGSPAINGTNFTASNLLPATASLATNTVGNNGTFVISGLQNGDNYSLNIADEFGCPVTITGTFQGVNASGFTYPQNAYCKDAANPSPTLTGVTGGTYTGSAGLVINGTTGVINIAATPAGNYVVTYTSPGAPCNSSSTFNIAINPLPVVTAPNVAVCNGQVANLTASGANNYSWSPATGLNTTTGPNVAATLTANQTYTITGTNTTTGCVNTGTVTVTVNPNPTPVINGQSDYCAGTSATIQTTQTYASYSWSTGQSTASIQVTMANNPIQVTVTNAFGCSGTSAAYTVTENSVITVNSQVEICQGQSTLIHGISRTAPGVYSRTLPSSNGCDSTSNVTLIVNSLPVIDAGPNQTVCEGETVVITATGAPTITWSPTQTNGVGFVQPVGTQIYTATGTDANNCVNTDQVEITVRPNPVVSAVAPQTRCNGSSTAAVNFTSSVAGTTYAWTNDTPSIGLPSNGNGNISSFTATNTTSNPVVATITVTPTAAGCVGSPVSFTITVQPSPTASISGTTAVCIGGPSPQVTFTGGTGTAPYTIAYNINGGANQTVTTTGNTATVNAPTASSGMFVYTLTNVTESGNTCSAPANGSVTITVNALPVINAGNDVAVCQNGQITLTATGAGVNGNYSWLPTVTNGVSFVPAASGIYTVTGTDANGCINTDNLNVTVNVAQNVDAGPNQEICIGEQVILSGSPTGTGATFLWTGGITDGVAFTPNQSGTYTVTSTDVNGCNSTDQVDVIVRSLPIIEAGSNISGCEGDQYTLTGSGAGVGGTYTWNHGVQNGVPFAPVAAVGSYVVVGTDQYGCFNSDSILAKIEAIPVVSFYAVIDQNCVPASVTFYNTTTDPAVNCIWNFDDGSTISGCGPVTHIFQHAGVYGASLQLETPVNGCPASLYQSAIVTVDANPVAHFTPNPAIGTQVNNQISFTNQSHGASSYYWEFGDGIGTSTDVNPVYTYGEEADLYTVMLIAYSNAGCVDTAYSLVTIQEELIFYVPNTFTPDLDQYNEVFRPIFTYGYNPFDYTLMIFNRWGEMVFESHDASVGWDGTYGVDGKICQDGTYTWKIEVKTTSSDERKMFTGHVNILR